jgi:hypothetical protein
VARKDDKNGIYINPLSGVDAKGAGLISITLRKRLPTFAERACLLESRKQRKNTFHVFGFLLFFP